MIGMTVPYDDPNLLQRECISFCVTYLGGRLMKGLYTETGNAAQSPWVIAINNAGIKSKSSPAKVQDQVTLILFIQLFLISSTLQSSPRHSQPGTLSSSAGLVSSMDLLSEDKPLGS
jgi:amino acid permease